MTNDLVCLDVFVNSETEGFQKAVATLTRCGIIKGVAILSTKPAWPVAMEEREEACESAGVSFGVGGRGENNSSVVVDKSNIMKNNDDDNDNDDSQIMDIRGNAAMAENDVNDDNVEHDNDEAPLAGVRLYYVDEEIAAATPTAQTSSTTTTAPSSGYSFPYPHSSSSSDSEDNDDGSTSTVVHNDCPPPPINATKDEINKLYWEWCYGPLSSSSSSSSYSSTATTTTIPTVVVIKDSEEGTIGVITTGSSYSGSRRREGLLPGKSCLSTSRKDDIMPTATKKSISREDSMTPRRLHLHHHHSPPLNVDDEEYRGGGSNSSAAVVVTTNNFSTPPDDDNNGSNAAAASTHTTTTATSTQQRQRQVVKQQRQSAVKFGTNTAAMFDSQLPITYCMTPIPYDDVQRIFPMIDNNQRAATTSTNDDGGGDATTAADDGRETARNIKLLAEWDDDFDNYTIEEDDDIYYNNFEDDDDDGNTDTGVENNCNGSSSNLRTQRTTKDIVGLSTPGGRTMKRGRKRTPSTRKQQQQQQQRLSSASRRKSSIFGSGGGKHQQRRGLIDFDNESDDGECGLLPFAVTINPDEYVSPTSTSTSTTTTATITTATTNQATSISLVGIMTPAGTATNPPPMLDNDDKEVLLSAMTTRDSLESVYVSPGSFKSSASSTIMTFDIVRGGNDEGCYYRHHAVNSKDTQQQQQPQQQQWERESFDSSFSISSGSNAASGTPSSARTSSSTLLRAVHASGALLHGSNNKDGHHHDDTNNDSNNVFNNDNSRIRPNQLKYSPRSSIGSCSSSSSSGGTLLGETFTSPSDKSGSGCNSLSSDIMSLFTHQFIGDDTTTTTTIDQQYSPTNCTTTTTDQEQQPPYLTLDKQLLILSNHPMQSFHTSIFDLIQWSCSSTYVDTDIMTFLMNVLSMKGGLSPSTIFDIIVYGIEQFRLLFSGKSFGTILMEEIETMTMKTSTSCLHPTATTEHDRLKHNDADCQTISSSIQKYYQSACLDWSRLEMEITDRALIRLRSWAESIEMHIQEFDNVLSTTTASYTQLMNADSMTESSILPRSRRGKKKSQITQARIDTLRSNVASLEDELAMEVNRLDQLIRTKQLFDARWDVERWSPISALYVEIRTSILLPSPIAVGHGMTQFSFQLLNGSAEIVMEILSDGDVKISNNDDDDDDVSVFSGNSDTSKSMTAKVSQLGYFIKDGGASMKLLKAILMGNDSDETMRVDNSFFGPYPLRTSLSSFIIGEAGSSNFFRDEILHHSSLIFSRIDTLVRSVREVEVDCYMLCVDVDSSGTDVSLSISLSHESDIELVLQINFLFDNLLHDSWCIMSLAPTNVHVSIISNSNDKVSQSSLLLGNQMQERAQRMIHAKSSSSSSTSDPILLRMICVEMKGMFYTMK